MTFKPGDKIRCIKGSPYSTDGRKETWANSLTNGKIYIVEKNMHIAFSDHFVTIRNDRDFLRSYSITRFELVVAPTADGADEYDKIMEMQDVWKGG